MQIDQTPFPVHMLELSNPKVLVRPSQAESTKGKNVVIGDERPEKKLTQEIPQGAKTLGGQDKKKADNKSTGLTGHNGGLTGAPSKSGNSSKIKTRPSFKELLAKYEKEGSAQRQKGPPSKVKDTGSSSRHQEQSSQSNYTSSSGLIAPVIVGILMFIHLWIIVGCICNHIIFNILLCIQIMHYYKD